MKRSSWLILLLIALAVAACSIRLLLPSWQPSQDATAATSGGKKLSVSFKSKPCVYVGPRHASGIYLSSGATQLDVELWDGRRLSFAADEELGLFAVHELDNKVYLVFTAEFKFERGFVAFAAKADENLFMPIAVNTLPPQVAYPNFGSRVMITRQTMAVHELPPPEFYHTKTAWLWSQIASNKSVAAESLNVDEVDKFWVAWAAKLASQMTNDVSTSR